MEVKKSRILTECGIFLIQLGIYYLRLVAFCFQCLEDLLLVAGAVGFHGDSQFHRRLPVDADELVRCV